ncbi:conjugal transfer protein TraI [Taibaiella koreensis]|uniref:conjugal transfer protein TraI n=1 Tax=Taibaiella koreensis TaxID=1268548 RepID=UPI000E59C350|nr:conjugal transfer protein TraI [Taibaiella koreensis]
MKKTILIFLLVPALLLVPLQKANAQLVIAQVIKAAITKVIKAVDLAIQRQQNKIIWLQNAQKTLENTLSKLKLDEISNWTQKQKDLYQKYFDELQQVKAIISYYKRIHNITDKQVQLVREYNRAWGLLSGDKHFTPKEIEYMAKVYQGILSETTKNIDEMILVINSFKTQMTDEKRLEIINKAGDHVDRNFADLQRFNTENAVLSLHRSSSDAEYDLIKRMYGIQ